MEVKDLVCRFSPALNYHLPPQNFAKPLPRQYKHHSCSYSQDGSSRTLLASPKVGSFRRVVARVSNAQVEPMTRKKLAVFVSGGGSNFKSIHEACVSGAVPGDVVVLVTNNQECGGAEFARNKDIPVLSFPRTKKEPDGLSPDDLVDALRMFEIDFILLAGYLKLVPVELVRAYPRSIVNIHPSLLPAFGGHGYYGMKVHKAVIASGARYSGPTIHFVDEQYDTGRILAQRVVPVLANDTPEALAARVLQEEHRLYVEVTAALCEDRIRWREDGIPLIRIRENPREFV